MIDSDPSEAPAGSKVGIAAGLETSREEGGALRGVRDDP